MLGLTREGSAIKEIEGCSCSVLKLGAHSIRAKVVKETVGMSNPWAGYVITEANIALK